MAEGRLYKVGFDNVAVTAVQDLVLVKASATNGLALRRFSISASGVTAAQELRLRLKRMAATVTVGSGGGAGTLVKTSSNNANTTLSSARTNDTTQATSSGTTDVLATWNWNVLQDFLEVPPTEEERWQCTLSEALVFDLIGAPAASITMSGFMVFREV